MTSVPGWGTTCNARPSKRRRRSVVSRVVGDPDVMATWRRLLTSDHFYYMFMGAEGADGRVHQHFSSYGSPFDAYANYMNSLTDLRQRLDRHLNVPAPAAAEET